jgi:hypothetical protein
MLAFLISMANFQDPIPNWSRIAGSIFASGANNHPSREDSVALRRSRQSSLPQTPPTYFPEESQLAASVAKT